MPKGNPADALSPQSYWGGGGSAESLNQAKEPQCDTLPRGSGSSYEFKAVYALKTVFPASEVFSTFLELFALKLISHRSMIFFCRSQ